MEESSDEGISHLGCFGNITHALLNPVSVLQSGKGKTAIRSMLPTLWEVRMDAGNSLMRHVC